MEMLKKSLIAIATLGAFAGSAMAADITISGRIDTGLNFHDREVKELGVTTVDENTFQMKTGQYSSSRITIKGSEDLGNGMKVGFILENGFDSDNGDLAQDGKIFGREAIVYLEGDFGHFSMGREGALSSGVGSYNVVYGFSPWGTGWGDYANPKGQFMVGDRDRFNNTLTYRSPEFAGVQVYAQYSLAADADEDDQSTKNKRYAGLGATYKLGAFSTGIVVDTIMNKSTEANTEDSLGVSWGASYDFGVTKPMILVQYGKNENKLGGFGVSDLYYFRDNMRNLTNEGLTGYGVILGAITPLLGGNLYTSVSYTDGEFDGDATSQRLVGEKWESSTRVYDGDIQRWGIAVGYDYPLSKRTKLYGFAAYNEGEIKGNQAGGNPGDPTSGKLEQTDIEAGVGLIHYF
jgi:predicted porin